MIRDCWCLDPRHKGFFHPRLEPTWPTSPPRDQAKLAAEIMDAKYGKGWRDRPMLRSPEWIAAWEEASGVTPTPAGTGGDDSHAAAVDEGPGIDQNPSDPTNTEHRV